MWRDGAPWIAFAALLTTVAAPSCGGSEGDQSAGEPWGAEAEVIFDDFAASIEKADGYDVAVVFSGGGSIDLRMGSGGVQTEPVAIAAGVRRVLRVLVEQGVFGSGVTIETDRVFLGKDQAVVRFDAFDTGSDRHYSWVLPFVIAPDSTVASRVYLQSFPADPVMGVAAPGWRYAYDRYVSTFAERRVDELGDVFGANAVVHDAMTGETWTGVDEIAELVRSDPAISAGPFPQHFGYASSTREMVATFWIDDDCPQLVARRWILDDQLRIEEETRFVEVESVRRCGLSPGDGWWSWFEPAPPTDRLGSAEHLLEGVRVDIVNAEPGQVKLAEWLFARYVEGGLEPPDLAALWYPPSLDCPEYGSLARNADARYEGAHTVTLCFGWRELVPETFTRTWSFDAVRYGLHELAHVWMYDHLDDATRAEFVERTGLDVWRSSDVPWGERGVESAAETIAWGLAGDEHAMYEISPRPDCDELVARYQMLTERTPLTTCPADGEVSQ